MQTIQQNILSGTTAIARVAGSLHLLGRTEDTVRLTDALHLLFKTSVNISNKPREMIMREMNEENRALCAKESPVMEFLVGEDLPKSNRRSRLQVSCNTNLHSRARNSPRTKHRAKDHVKPLGGDCVQIPHTLLCQFFVEGTPPYAWIGKAASLLGRVEIGYNTVESQWKKQTRGAPRRGYVGCNKLLFYRKKIPCIGASDGCYQGQLSYYCCSPGQLVLLPG